MNNRTALICIVIFCIAICSCTYMEMVRRQRSAEKSLQRKPSQTIKKKIIGERCLIVYGQIKSKRKISSPLVVAAFSIKYGKLELVDHKDLTRTGFYTLSLPLGQYQIFVFTDINNDSSYTNSECVGYYKGNPFLDVEEDDSAETILHGVDVEIDPDNRRTVDFPFELPVAPARKEIHSAFYPSGSVRYLDDDLFSCKMGALGLYNPAAFLSQIDMYFYAIRERDWCKIPIVFVHGIGGTPHDWKYIVERIDSSRFEPWFFYYPSGERLNKMAEAFFEIFLSGRIIHMRKRSLIIFAHSMGGLVARSAINKYSREVEGDFVELFVSICTPYGGNDAAAQGVEKAPVVIDSWLDLATGGEFIKALHETPLPEHLKFHLLFGYRNDNPVKIGPNSDGTISLESQLDSRAQSCAATVCGFNETHTSILESEEVLHKINDLLSPYTRLDSDGTESRCISQELIERYRMREGAERQEAEDRRRTTD